MTRPDALDHQLILLPRDHQKSRMIAYRVAWEITRKPWIRVLYISATAALAEKQLYFIKGILTSPIYRKYWPEMVSKDEGRRTRWTVSEISVDHPRRVEEGVAEPTVFTGGLTTSITGFHCDIAVLDDVVVQENAYTQEGRDKVESQYSLLASIESGEAQEWVVGTHYHPKDLYTRLKSMEEEIFNDEGEIIDKEPVYEVYQKVVEDVGDGTGTFLWPRQQRSDGRWFGFDRGILAKKRAKYLDKTQFRAQYYNDPNDVTESPISRDRFQYYDTKHLTREAGYWYFNGRRLNVYGALDLAFSTTKGSDYTALVVIGLDYDKNVYILDIERMRTSMMSDYFDLIRRMHLKWDMRKLIAETVAGQKAIIKSLKTDYLRPNGITLAIEEVPRHRHQGTKEERVHAALQPRYEELKVWHYVGGEIANLEEELTLKNPPHDDVKDALAAALEYAIPPMDRWTSKRTSNVVYHRKFGGVAY